MLPESEKCPDFGDSAEQDPYNRPMMELVSNQESGALPALKHIQVREYVRGLVDGCEPGASAPSERELVQRFGVARMTVRQAMDALVGEGLLVRVPGRGTFVAQPRTQPGKLLSFSQEMTQRGLLPESQTLIARREKAGPGVAKALSLTEGDPVIHWKRLRRADGSPVCVEDAYLNEVLLPGFLQSGMPTSLYEALDARGLRPTWAEDSVSADLATAEEAAHLEVDPGSAVLRVARRALVDDRPIEVSRAVLRGDRYTLWVQFDGSL
ncbi:Transcriptional regulator, GntR family [metagenome]|uniref:Transcriptional regulator, GntR family n=1 Tax=metagenome TaxID=256318 RepID=A0A2P2CC60_9ZZZZ